MDGQSRRPLVKVGTRAVSAHHVISFVQVSDVPVSVLRDVPKLKELVALRVDPVMQQCQHTGPECRDLRHHELHKGNDAAAQ